eukprot:TRINITY_DN1094_c0_g1_i5.p1 TRINITY_DN1094_c0_g1~~TRINITY_DN1094_c0_g1_i5.p1  ORF type:complete len:117 (+),score=24.51 TRINITY_DN1094_c0_g1_i5:148-498(+)
MALLQALLCTLILVPSVLGAPLGNLRKLSDAADRGAGSCYVINDHGTCTMLLGAANNPDSSQQMIARASARRPCARPMELCCWQRLQVLAAAMSSMTRAHVPCFWELLVLLFGECM